MARQLRKWMLIALIFVMSTGVAAADQCKGFRFAQVQSLPLQDLGRLARQKVVAGEPGFVVFIPFDEEDYPRQGQFRALGFVFARMGDLGETPIGGYIWISKDAIYQDYKVGKKANSVSITFILGDAQHCATPRLDFELKPMGRVYVNGAVVGTIH